MRQIEVAVLAGYGAIELWFSDVDAHVALAFSLKVGRERWTLKAQRRRHLLTFLIPSHAHPHLVRQPWVEA